MGIDLHTSSTYTRVNTVGVRTIKQKISCFYLLKQITDWFVTGMLKFPLRHFDVRLVARVTNS